jgi:long-chain acyl-CoA synthetase
MTNRPSLQQLARDALQGDNDGLVLRDGTSWYDRGWVRDTAENIVDLLDAADVRRDLPVGLVARNRPTVAAALLALIADGRSVRMVYAYQAARMLANDIASGEIAAVVAADEDFSAPVVEAVEKAGICAVSVHEEAGVGLVGDAPAPSGNPPAAPVDDSDQLYIEVLTSGTTGPPKHFRISHEVILRRLLSVNVTYSDQAREDAGSPVSLMFYPLGTISGLYRYLPPALNGSPVILQEKFDLDGWLDFVRRYRPHRASLPPPGIDAMLSREIPREALDGINFIGTGAAPIDVETQAAFEEHFGVPLLISYGATEFGGPVAAMTAKLIDDWGSAKRGSAGLPWADFSLRIVDPESGEELPRATNGILEAKSPSLGDGHWLRTSDLAMIDQDGFLYLRGRADGAITRGGFSILPEVIEQVIARHPQVAAAAVVGLSHRRLGEVPVAAVQPRDPEDPPDLAELERHVRDHVFATHIPTQFRIVQELPLNPSLKVDLARVRALFDKKPAEKSSAP